MTYTAAAIVFLLACTLAGTLGGPALARPRVVAVVAAAMVAAQLLLLLRP